MHGRDLCGMFQHTRRQTKTQCMLHRRAAGSPGSEPQRDSREADPGLRANVLPQPTGLHARPAASSPCRARTLAARLPAHARIAGVEILVVGVVLQNGGFTRRQCLPFCRPGEDSPDAAPPIRLDVHLPHLLDVVLVLHFAPRLPPEGFLWSRTLVQLLKTVHESAAVGVPGALVAVLPLNDVLPALRAIGEPPLLSSIHCRMGRGTTVGLTRLLLPCGSHLIGRCRVRCRLLPRCSSGCTLGQGSLPWSATGPDRGRGRRGRWPRRSNGSGRLSRRATPLRPGRIAAVVCWHRHRCCE